MTADGHASYHWWLFGNLTYTQLQAEVLSEDLAFIRSLHILMNSSAGSLQLLNSVEQCANRHTFLPVPAEPASCSLPTYCFRHGWVNSADAGSAHNNENHLQKSAYNQVEPGSCAMDNAEWL